MNENEQMKIKQGDGAETEEVVSEQTDKKDIPYLPIGSVVLLKEGKKRVMIYGRRMKTKGEDKEYDYMGCIYPEGASGNDDVILFNQEQIQMIYFIGFQDLEELIYRTEILGGQENGRDNT